MKILVAAAVLVSATGCVAYDGYGGYDGYYDDFYGPYYGGYWGGDGFFYYSSRDHHYFRDDGRHFRHERFDGGRPFHGEHRRDHDHR